MHIKQKISQKKWKNEYCYDNAYDQRQHHNTELKYDDNVRGHMRCSQFLLLSYLPPFMPPMGLKKDLWPVDNNLIFTKSG